LDSGLPEDAIEVGRVLGAWGVKGWIKVQPYADDPQALFSTKRWYLQPPEAVGPKAAVAPQVLRVIQAREQGDDIVAGIHDLDDRDAAQALRGCRVFVPRSSFPTAADDEYYWVDLIGLSVVNRQGEGLGTVVGLIETGPQCVLRLRPLEIEGPLKPADERLIPFVGAFVDRVDLAGQTITVDWSAQD
jgi:16S rRNA processing protein RimM